MTADQYNAKLRAEEAEAKRNKQLAIRKCIQVGMNGTQDEIDAALAALGRAEMAEASYGSTQLG